jgi:iron complex outermembrane receptor protein
MKSLCTKLKGFLKRCSLNIMLMSALLLGSFSGEASVYLATVSEIDFQDTNIVSGVVTDENGNGLPGVSILIEGTSNGTITELDGSYRINVESNSGVLIFTFLGYEKREISVLNKSVIDVSMVPDIKSLEGVVVTAMGIEREDKTIGYAVSTLKGEELAQATLVNPVSTLQGKTAGVQISTTSGGTFGGSRITIRGNSTFGQNTQPIFVVDNVIMDNDISGTGGADWGNQLKNLNPDDFESVTILKGAAASALYGSRAINGVVIITTKSGRKKKGIGVTFNQTTGTRFISDQVDFQDQYGQGQTAGWFTFNTNGPNTYPREDKHDTRQFPFYDITTNLPSMQYNQYEEHAASWGPKFEGQEYLDYDGSRAQWTAQPDNYRKTFNTGIINNTNISLDGAGENNSFRVSFSNFSEKGVIPRNNFDRKSLSIKGKQELIENRLSVGALFHYTRSLAENPVNPGANSDWFHTGFSRSYDVDKWKDNYKALDGGVPYPTGDGNYYYTHYSAKWMTTNHDYSGRTEGSLLAKATIDYKIIDNLNLSVEGNINQFTYSTESKGIATSADRLNGSYALSNGEKFQSTFDAKLMYDAEFNSDFTLNLIAGANSWNTKSIGTGLGTRGGFVVRDFYNITNSRLNPNVSGGTSYEKRINSFYGYATASFRNSVFLNVTARNDWSSALVYPDGSGDPSYFYHSESLSWVLSDDITLPTAISSLRLRASYAEVGNDTDPFRISTGFVPAGIGSTNIPMYRFENATAVSPNIRPEKKKSIELGFNALLFEGLVNFDFNFYKDNTIDQIIPLSVPSESGIQSILLNGGNIQNQGFEVMVDVAIIDRQDISWNLGFNWTTNKDKIIELVPGVTEFNLYGNPSDANAATASYAYAGGVYGDLVTRKGYKPYQATDAGGNNIDHPNNGIPILSPRNGWSIAYPIGIQNLDSLHVMGNMQSDWFGGLNSNFRYKGLSLGVLFDVRWGGEIYSADARYGLHQGVIKSSLPNRDASQGGIVWTSNGQGQNFFGKEYEDGYIPHGVFPDGTTVTSGPSDNRTSVEVGGLTYEEAYNQGLVEPTHWSGYVYRWTSASTGTPITGVYTQKWVALREVSLAYQLPAILADRLRMQNASLILTARDLPFIYNSMPDNINPTISNNLAANPLQMNSAPYITSMTLGFKANF